MKRYLPRLTRTSAATDYGDLFVRWLERQDKDRVIIAALAAIALVAATDYFVEYPNISIGIFYVLPIAAVSGRLGLRAGMTVAGTTLVIWQWCDLLTRTYDNSFIPVWNFGSRLLTLSIVVLLVSSLRSAHARERRLARTDILTGADNRLSFLEQLEAVLEQSRRHGQSFVVAYIDVDRFKLINDRRGHSLGDRFLCQTVDCIRRTDMIARIGGDEFAILFTDTTAEQAVSAIARIQANLDAMTESFNFDFPVGHSIGWVAFEVPPSTTKEVLDRADQQMYLVKSSRRTQ